MGKGKRRSRHSTNNNNNDNKTHHPPSSSNSNSTTSSPPTTTTTTTTPPSRLRLLPRELRDKIYESICLAPNDSTFTMPSPSSICGLGREMGAELMETFHREILARNEAEIILLPRTRKYHISWSFDTTLPADAEPCVHITLPVQVWREGPCRVAPDTMGNGEGPDSSIKASIWREPDKSGGENGRACQRTTCNKDMPNANARMLFLDWLNQREKSVPPKRRKYVQELKSLLVDFNNGVCTSKR